MNKIEQTFFDAWNKVYENDCSYDLVPGKVIGPYRVDFFIEDSFCRFVIEIDGHETHKTKEQRDADYKRERYFQKNKIHVIRFMGTEVFLNADGCIEEMDDIISAFGSDQIDLMYCQELCFEHGLIAAKMVKESFEDHG